MAVRAPLPVLALAILAGCGGVISAADVEGRPPFPECEADSYAFIGETSLAALGLADRWPEQAGRIGEVWITAVPPDPGAVIGPPGMPPPNQRHICLEFDDGSGMSGPIGDAWQPPGGGVSEFTAAGGAPWAAVILLGAVIVVGAASVLAFRGAPRSS